MMRRLFAVILLSFALCPVCAQAAGLPLPAAVNLTLKDLPGGGFTNYQTKNNTAMDNTRIFAGNGFGIISQLVLETSNAGAVQWAKQRLQRDESFGWGDEVVEAIRPLMGTFVQGGATSGGVTEFNVSYVYTAQHYAGALTITVGDSSDPSSVEKIDILFSTILAKKVARALSAAPATLPLPTTTPDQPSGITRFVGNWEGHGRNLNISANGAVAYIARSYVWCGPGIKQPCDSATTGNSMQGINVQAKIVWIRNETAQAKITASSIPHTVGQTVSLALLAHGRINMSGPTTWLHAVHVCNAAFFKDSKNFKWWDCGA